MKLKQGQQGLTFFGLLIVGILLAAGSSRRFGADNAIFHADRQGFHAHLPYHILTCVAK